MRQKVRKLGHRPVAKDTGYSLIKHIAISYMQLTVDLVICHFGVEMLV